MKTNDYQFIEDENVRIEVNNMLLQDLRSYGISDRDDLEIDWSNVVEEGSGTDYKGLYVESASDVSVKNKRNECIYNGWVDHITDSKGRLFSFWTILDSSAGRLSSGEHDFSIPVRIWKLLSEEDKYYLAETYQGWSQDKNLLPYRKVVVTKQIKESSTEVSNIIDNIDNYFLPEDFNKNLYIEEGKKLLDLADNFLSKKELNPNISTNTHELWSKVEDYKEKKINNTEKVQEIFRILEKLESAVRHAAIAIRKL